MADTEPKDPKATPTTEESPVEQQPVAEEDTGDANEEGDAAGAAADAPETETNDPTPAAAAGDDEKWEDVEADGDAADKPATDAADNETAEDKDRAAVDEDELEALNHTARTNKSTKSLKSVKSVKSTRSVKSVKSAKSAASAAPQKSNASLGTKKTSKASTTAERNLENSAITNDADNVDIDKVTSADGATEVSSMTDADAHTELTESDAVFSRAHLKKLEKERKGSRTGKVISEAATPTQAYLPPVLPQSAQLPQRRGLQSPAVLAEDTGDDRPHVDGLSPRLPRHVRDMVKSGGTPQGEGGDVVDRMQKLAVLLCEGLLTPEEFASAKQEVLRSIAGPAHTPSYETQRGPSHTPPPPTTPPPGAPQEPHPVWSSDGSPSLGPNDAVNPYPQALPPLPPNAPPPLPPVSAQPASLPPRPNDSVYNPPSQAPQYPPADHPSQLQSHFAPDVDLSQHSPQQVAPAVPKPSSMYATNPPSADITQRMPESFLMGEIARNVQPPRPLASVPVQSSPPAFQGTLSPTSRTPPHAQMMHPSARAPSASVSRRVPTGSQQPAVMSPQMEEALAALMTAGEPGEGHRGPSPPPFTRGFSPEQTYAEPTPQAPHTQMHPGFPVKGLQPQVPQHVDGLSESTDGLSEKGRKGKVYQFRDRDLAKLVDSLKDLMPQQQPMQVALPVAQPVAQSPGGQAETGGLPKMPVSPDRRRRLRELRDAGLLTDGEYDAALRNGQTSEAPSQYPPPAPLQPQPQPQLYMDPTANAVYPGVLNPVMPQAMPSDVMRTIQNELNPQQPPEEEFESLADTTVPTTPAANVQPYVTPHGSQVLPRKSSLASHVKNHPSVASVALPMDRGVSAMSKAAPHDRTTSMTGAPNAFDNDLRAAQQAAERILHSLSPAPNTAKTPSEATDDSAAPPAGSRRKSDAQLKQQQQLMQNQMMLQQQQQQMQELLRQQQQHMLLQQQQQQAYQLQMLMRQQPAQSPGTAQSPLTQSSPARYIRTPPSQQQQQQQQQQRPDELATMAHNISRAQNLELQQQKQMLLERVEQQQQQLNLLQQHQPRQEVRQDEAAWKAALRAALADPKQAGQLVQIGDALYQINPTALLAVLSDAQPGVSLTYLAKEWRSVLAGWQYTRRPVQDSTSMSPWRQPYAAPLAQPGYVLPSAADLLNMRQ